MTYEEKMIKELYKIYEKANDDDKPVLYWAIFQLERKYDVKLKDGDK